MHSISLLFSLHSSFSLFVFPQITSHVEPQGQRSSNRTIIGARVHGRVSSEWPHTPSLRLRFGWLHLTTFWTKKYFWWGLTPPLLFSPFSLLELHVYFCYRADLVVQSNKTGFGQQRIQTKKGSKRGVDYKALSWLKRIAKQSKLQRKHLHLWRTWKSDRLFFYPTRRRNQSLVRNIDISVHHFGLNQNCDLP